MKTSILKIATWTSDCNGILLCGWWLFHILLLLYFYDQILYSEHKYNTNIIFYVYPKLYILNSVYIQRFCCCCCFWGIFCVFGVFFLFIGNILDGEHPTQLWLGGFQQPMKMASPSLEDGIPGSDTMDSSYPRLESVPRDHLKHLHLPPQISICISKWSTCVKYFRSICGAQLRSQWLC